MPPNEPVLPSIQLKYVRVLHIWLGQVRNYYWLCSGSNTSTVNCCLQASCRSKRAFPATASRSRGRRGWQHCSCCGSCAAGSNSCACTPAAAIGENLTSIATCLSVDCNDQDAKRHEACPCTITCLACQALKRYGMCRTQEGRHRQRGTPTRALPGSPLRCLCQTRQSSEIERPSSRRHLWPCRCVKLDVLLLPNLAGCQRYEMSCSAFLMDSQAAAGDD